MQKKQANLFYTSPKINSAPFMTSEQLREFKTEFTLFHSHLDLEKLKEQIYQNDIGGSTVKYLEIFLNHMQKNNDKVSFQTFIEELVRFLEKQDQAELIMNILGGDEKQLSKDLIRAVTEETMDRDLSTKEQTLILEKIFQPDFNFAPPDFIGKQAIQ